MVHIVFQDKGERKPNGQSKDTCNTGFKKQNEDKENIYIILIELKIDYNLCGYK